MCRTVYVCFKMFFFGQSPPKLISWGESGVGYKLFKGGVARGVAAAADTRTGPSLMICRPQMTCPHP
jgi:hypothetical protein